MIRQDADCYIEKNRVDKDKKPIFHFVPPVGWMNDPNGFSIFDNRVHMFYQFHPYSEQWGPMHWGHVVSEDFLRWKELPVALAPDSDFDYAGCFSGTAIEKDGKHILFYTGVTETETENGEKIMLQNQCMALGDGKCYEKYAGNPVVSGTQLPEDCSRIDFRDPKVFKGKDGIYYLLAGNKDLKDVPQVVLFSSKNLTKWEFVSVFAKGDNVELGAMWECPDFFSMNGSDILLLSPQFMEADEEFHNGNNVAYLMGEVNRSSMTFSYEQAYSMDYGFDFYAPQTVETKDNRRVMIGWLQSWDSTDNIPKENRFAGMMSIPRELRMKNGRIYQSPVRELEEYRTNERIVETQLLGNAEYDGISGRVTDLNIQLKGGDYTTFEVKLAADEKHHTSIIYHVNQGMLEFDRTYAGWKHDTNTIRKVKLYEGLKNLRIIMDKNSIEVFVNDGQQVLSTVLYTPQTANRILFATDGMMELNIQKYDLQMKDEK